jgi:low affinity Fe/Cu permease
MKEILDSSFKKFIIFFVTLMAIFVTRFCLYSYTRMDDITKMPNEWPFPEVWVLYLTYFTEFVLILQIFLIRKNQKGKETIDEERTE